MINNNHKRAVLYCSTQSGQGVAVVTRVSSEALAQTSGVVALATAAALVAVVVSQTDFSGVTGLLVVASLQVQAVNLGSASVTALVGLNDKHVLGALHRGTSEGDVHHHLTRGVTHSSGDSDTVNNSVGQVQQSQLDIVNQIGKISIIKRNGNSGEGFVQSGLESQGKSLGRQSGQLVAGLEAQLLNLVLGGDQQIVSHIQNISSVGAHSLRAINIAISGVADTAANLAVIPLSVRESLGIISVVLLRVVIPGGSIGHVLNILTSTMSRAIIGGGSSLASLAFVTVKASTLTTVSVANTAASALSVLVEGSLVVRSINPSQLKRANTFRAITAVVAKTNSPIVITHANIVSHARSMSTAIVITVGIDR